MEAVRLNGDAPQYASEELKRDRDDLMEAIRTVVRFSTRFGGVEARQGSGDRGRQAEWLFLPCV